jgi:predicted nucleotidyltransferase
MGETSKRHKIESRKDIERFLRTFRKSLEKAGVKVESMVLFGSFARDQQHAQSDIDLCIVVPDSVKDTKPVHLKIVNLVYQAKRDIDVVTLRKSTYLKDRLSPLVHEIRKFGIQI